MVHALIFSGQQDNIQHARLCIRNQLLQLPHTPHQEKESTINGTGMLT